MAKLINITLTSIGSSNGTSFDIYTDADSYATPVATSVTQSLLLAGYTVSVPDAASLLKFNAGGSCGLQPAAGISITGLTPSTPTPTPTVTPTPTPAFITPTPTPTVTPTPTPTVTPIPAVSLANKIVLDTTTTNICNGTAEPTLYCSQNDYDNWLVNGIFEGMQLFYNNTLTLYVNDKNFAFDKDFIITRPINTSNGVLGSTTGVVQC